MHSSMRLVDCSRHMLASHYLRRIPFGTSLAPLLRAAGTGCALHGRASYASRMLAASSQVRAAHPRLATPALTAASYRRKSTASMAAPTAPTPALTSASLTALTSACNQLTSSLSTASTAATDILKNVVSVLGPACSAASSSAPSSALPEVPSDMVSEANLLAAFSEVPVVNTAVVRATAVAGGTAGGVTVTAGLQQRNLPANSQRRFNVTAALLTHGSAGAPEDGAAAAATAVMVGLPQEVAGDVQLVSVAPSGLQQLVAVRGPPEGAPLLLQWWRGGRMRGELAVPKSMHGPLLADGYFAAGAAWSPDESAVAYVAESAAPERTPAWGGPECPEDGDVAPRSWRGVGTAQEDWGELYSGKRPPALFVLDLRNSRMLTIPGLPADHSFGQLAWGPPPPRTTAAAPTTPAVAAPAAAAATATADGTTVAALATPVPDGDLSDTNPIGTDSSATAPAPAPAPGSPSGKAGVAGKAGAAAAEAGEAAGKAETGKAEAGKAAAGETAAGGEAAEEAAGALLGSLVCVAWPHRPPPSFPRLAAGGGSRKLGAVFCYNRSAHLYGVGVRRKENGSLLLSPRPLRLAPSLDSCLSPLFSPAGDHLVFLSHQQAVDSGTHGGTARLYRLDWSTETCRPASPEPRLLVDVVQRPAGHPGAPAFPGLYTAALPEQGFVGPHTLLLNTQWGAVNTIAAVDTAPPPATPAAATAADTDAAAAPDGAPGGSPPPPPPHPTPLTPLAAPSAASSPSPPTTPLGTGSWSLLGAAGGWAVAARAAPDCPPELQVARLPADPASLTGPGAGPASLSWSPLDVGRPGLQLLTPGGAAAPHGGDSGSSSSNNTGSSSNSNTSSGSGSSIGSRSELPAAVQEALDTLEYRVLSVPPPEGDDPAPFDCLVWAPRERKGPLPAVLIPHGGPHVGMTLSWFPPYAYLAALGYVVLAPNYRGSTGYGQAALASLPGRVGTQDVGDCMAALGAAVEAGLVDPLRVSAVGGSHGGFLTAHLMGQHPDKFCCGVVRNPVTNLALMVGLSDIPDWCYVEAMGCEEGRARARPLPSPADLAALFAVSPAAHAHAVSRPLCVMLGARDRRVPPPDGMQFLAAVRGREGGGAPPTRLIVFPEDSHGLDKPQTEFENWINIAWWLKMYGNGSGSCGGTEGAASAEAGPGAGAAAEKREVGAAKKE